MKNKIMISLIALGIVLSSCDRFFSPDTNDVIREEESMKKRAEIYSAFIGMASLFQEVASQYLLLSELRGDMMEPTQNAPEEMWQIYRYETTADNSLAKPGVFYRVILGANDFIRHLRERKAENSEIVEENVYKGMISQALCYRNWCYLNLGKIYGEAAWYDYALADVIDPAEVPVLKFRELVPELINSMLRGVEGIGGMNGVEWADDILGNGDYGWNRVAVDAKDLMTELYIWQGDYQKTLESAMNVMLATSGDVNKFKISGSYKNSAWKTMISAALGNAIYERQTVIPFSVAENQICPFQYWLLVNYHLRPVPSVAERFERQERTDGGVGDRYRGEGVTYTTKGKTGELAVTKYAISNQNADAPVIIYRAADLHFMLMEALNRLGYTEEALVLLNDGLSSYWTGSAFLPPFDNPLFPASLRENIGIRGRVSLKPVRPAVFDDPAATAEQKAFALDSLILEEMAMESAYEGKRLFTMIRMAEYWNRPEMVANPLSEKFGGEAEKYRTYLMNLENWFIRVKHNE